MPAPNTDFVAIAAGGKHSLALKADGSIVAWGAGQAAQSGWPHHGQCNVPAPNTDFVAVAAGGYFSLGIKGYPRGDLDHDRDMDLDDFALFAGCMAGPDGTDPPPGCDPIYFARGDLDNDEDMDLAEFAKFQTLFTGSR
ncbi:MAG: hypothetical protein WBE26_11395 [Phycisphaerae bacterium]